MGTGKPGPDSRWVSVKEEGCSWSTAELEALVEDALDATEALWAILRWVRSRDRRLTWLSLRVREEMIIRRVMDK